MTCISAKELIAASWLNELDAASESNLNQHLATCEECRAEHAQLSGIWQQLGSLPAAEPARAMRARFENSLDAIIAEQRTRPVRTWSFANLWPRTPAWQGAIALACLLTGLLVGPLVSSKPRGYKTSSDKEISKLHEEIASTRAMVALSLLQQQSASSRLQGVDYSGRMATMAPEIVSALVNAASHDPSVNVRLAAIDALGKSANSGVLNALTSSLPQQDSPMVQAALIDYFVDARDRQAVGAIRHLSEQPDINPAVLEKSHAALRELSQ